MQPAIIDTCCTCAQRQNLPAGYLLWLSVWERAWGYTHCPRGWTWRGLGWSGHPGAATRVGRGRRTDEQKEMVEVKVDGEELRPIWRLQLDCIKCQGNRMSTLVCRQSLCLGHRICPCNFMAKNRRIFLGHRPTCKAFYNLIFICECWDVRGLPLPPPSGCCYRLLSIIPRAWQP